MGGPLFFFFRPGAGLTNQPRVQHSNPGAPSAMGCKYCTSLLQITHTGEDHIESTYWQVYGKSPDNPDCQSSSITTDNCTQKYIVQRNWTVKDRRPQISVIGEDPHIHECSISQIWRCWWQDDDLSSGHPISTHVEATKGQLQCGRRNKIGIRWQQHTTLKHRLRLYKGGGSCNDLILSY